MDMINENWNEIKETVRREYILSDISYHTWIEPLEFYNVENDIVNIIIPSDQAIDLESELREYKDLLDKGILTEEEFDAKKAELLRIGKAEHSYSDNKSTASFISDNTNIETNNDFRDLPEI